MWRLSSAPLTVAVAWIKCLDKQTKTRKILQCEVLAWTRREFERDPGGSGLICFERVLVISNAPVIDFSRYLSDREMDRQGSRLIERQGIEWLKQKVNESKPAADWERNTEEEKRKQKRTQRGRLRLRYGFQVNFLSVSCPLPVW